MKVSSWTSCRLGELVDIKHGWPFKSELFSEELTSMPIIVSIGNFRYTCGFRFHETSRKEYRGEYPKDYELAPGDILLVMTCQTAGGEILGIPARVPDDDHVYLHNQRLGKVVIHDTALVENNYLYWLFLWEEFNRELVSTASGTKILHTAPSRIIDFKFMLPPLSEQRAIAHILGTLDDKIELNRRTNETLEAMARTLFKSWFVDFDPVRAKMEGRKTGLPKHIADLFPDSFVDSELGKIPKGWEISSIGHIAEIIDCLHAKKPYRRETGMPFLQLENILDNGLIDMQNSYYIDQADYQKWISRMEASPGDCVITNVGRVGVAAQIPQGLRAALGRNMTGIRCKKEYPFPTFLIECLLSKSMKDEITRKMDTGTILNALNVRNIPNLRFVLANRNRLEYFEHNARPIREQMEKLLDSSCTLSSLRDTLLPKLISGELRVKDAERIVGRAV